MKITKGTTKGNVVISKLMVVIFVLIFAISFFRAELGATVTYLTIGVLVAIFAWLDGFDRGKRVAKLISIKSTSLSVSQSLGRNGRGRVYSSYDCSGKKFFFDEQTYLNILKRFSEDLPFGGKINEDFWAFINKEGSNYWTGNWVFQTVDMNKNPIFLNDIAMTQIMDYFTLHGTDPFPAVESGRNSETVKRQKESWWRKLGKNGKVKLESTFN